MKSARLAFALAALCAAGGCARHTGPQDACTLLPKGVAESVLDVELTQARSQRFGENPRQAVISNCQYVATTPEPIRSLTFTIRAGGVSDASVGPAEGLISTMKQTFGQRYELKKLSGLGDGAVWDPSLHQLTVFAGTSTYVWAAPGATSPDLETKLVTLAKRTVVGS
jgi:hypothetical protein